LNFEFLLVLIHVDGDLGTTQRWELYENEIRLKTQSFGVRR
jgi:hypothetical protein